MALFPSPKAITAEEFGEDEYGTLLLYIEDHIKYVKAKCKGIREVLMPKWVRIYRGIPAEEDKTWPWPGASNLVIQVAGTFCDELLSRVMAMYATDPLFNAGLLGDFDDTSNESGAEQAEELEYFLGDCALQPEELDLYRVEETGFSSAIRFGTGVFKFPWEYVVEQQAVHISGGAEVGDKIDYRFKDFTKRDGPHPENVPLSDWSIDPKWANLNLATFKVHTLHVNYYQLQDLKKNPDLYDPEAIDKICDNPDKVPEYRIQLEEQKQVETEEINHCAENYDIDEAWLTYNKNGELFKIIARYHEGSDTHLSQIYNMYPDNEEPFEDAKLAYDDDTYFGYGFCEMGEAYQREVSETHNWRTDNRRFATTGVGRVNKNSKLSSVLQLYPGVLIPADKDEVEALAFGQNAAQMDSSDEMQTLALAAQRFGVDPAEGGSGGATVNSKKGIVSAQGTAMSMQSKNNRNNLRMSDMRTCHVRMGRKLLKMYSHFGLGTKIRKYGNRAELIKKALANYKDGKLGLLIQPSTASLNSEMEKQNDVLLSTTLERLYQTDMQAMQQLFMSPAPPPPEVADLIKKQIKARHALQKSLLRAFQKRDYTRLLALPDFLTKERGAMNNGTAQRNGNGGINPQVAQPPGGNQGMVPVGGGATSGQVPVQ